MILDLHDIGNIMTSSISCQIKLVMRNKQNRTEQNRTEKKQPQNKTKNKTENKTKKICKVIILDLRDIDNVMTSSISCQIKLVMRNKQNRTEQNRTEQKTKKKTKNKTNQNETKRKTICKIMILDLHDINTVMTSSISCQIKLVMHNKQNRTEQYSAVPDSSTVPNTASNAKDHGNAPRRFVRDCGIVSFVCRKVGRIVENSAIGQNLHFSQI
jgi:hypothetical protein